MRISEIRMSLSVCIIVKNGAKDIIRAVHSMGQYADECVVVDTGSTDDTIKVLRDDHFTSCIPGSMKSDDDNPNKKLYSFEWVNDFSAARNYAQSLCTTDYILWLDADDYVPPETGELIEAAMHKPGPLTAAKRAVFSLGLVNVIDGKPSGESVIQPRIYPTGMGITWKGKIHETFVESVLLNPKLTNIITTNMQVWHYGYGDKTVEAEKMARNLEYLGREEKTPIVAYHIATTLMCMKEYEKAVKEYSDILEAFGGLNLPRDFRDHIRCQIGQCFLCQGKVTEAMPWFRDNNKFDAIVWEAECLYQSGLGKEAAEKYIKYLEIGKIHDPYGTKQVTLQKLCRERLMGFGAIGTKG